MVLIKRITAYNLDRCGKYRNYRICYDGIKYQSDCPSGNAIECEGWTKESLISMAGRDNTVYFNGELVIDSGVSLEFLNQQTAEAVALREFQDLQYKLNKIAAKADYLMRDVTWGSEEAYAAEVTETNTEITAFNKLAESAKVAGAGAVESVKAAGASALMVPVVVGVLFIGAVLVVLKK